MTEITGAGGSRAARRGGEICVAPDEKVGTEPFKTRYFGIGLVSGRNLDRALRTAARREIGQGVDGGNGVAAMLEEIAKGDGTDIFAAGEAQPRDPLGLGERCAHGGQDPAGFCPMRDSVPASRRRILSRWAM
ncbi:MAG: hypothetical protein KF899_14700 [Parvibaculum sp.]|nr:hypothetical protein [Parvibaculum sp.]